MTSMEYIKSESARAFAAVPLIASLDREGKNQICEALHRHCKSNEHVSTVLRTFLESVKEWYNPVAELVRIAKETIPVEKAPDGCTVCRKPGGGYEYTIIVRSPTDPLDFHAEYCKCPRGQWFKKKHAEHLRQRAEQRRQW